MDRPGAFPGDSAKALGERIGIDWSNAGFDVEQFRLGLELELELAGRTVWAHLREVPDYYTRLTRMQAEAERHWAERERRRLGGEQMAVPPRGAHPGEEGEPAGAPGVPEDEEVVPGRHSASAEAALLRWRESHDQDETTS